MSSDRYNRQLLCERWDEEKQAKLSDAHILIVGAGGLGSHSVSILSRLGVGALTIIDDDTISDDNLPRVALFDEDDIGLDKSTVAGEKAASMNSDCMMTTLTERLTKELLEDLIGSVDLILDATDTIETRLMIDSVCMEYGVPWVYGGIEDTEGMVLGIIPGVTACFHCLGLKRSAPREGPIPVMGMLPGIVSGLQCVEAVRLLMGEEPQGLVTIDCWSMSMTKIPIVRRDDCPCCGKR